MLAAVTVFAGCQGGATIGSGGATPITPGTTPTPVFSLAPGQSPTPKSTSSPTPVGATPSPTPIGATPSPTPTAVVTGAIYHPANNGDAFTMSGQLTITYDRSNQYPSPEPTQTTFDTVSQSVAVTSPATYNGASNAVDFKISETDNQTAPATQTFSDTLDTYFQFSNNIVTGNFLNLGSVEVDDTGYTTGVTTGPNDQLADILPETSGAKWSNMAGRTVTTNDNDGETSSTTYADDGSYTGTITYQGFMPSPNPTGSQLTNMASLTTKTDGSAHYVTPRLGTDRAYNYDYTIQAPTASGPNGTITETTTVPPAPNSTSTPEVVATTIPNWMPTTVPGSLYSETDVDNGPTALPASCVVPTAYTGTMPNQIVQTKTAVDPLNGDLDVTTTTTYDTVNIGPVCVVLHDVQQAFYDYSGQNGAGYFSGVSQQTTTIDEVLYLQLETLESIARRPSARYSVTRAVNLATAQGHVASLREAQRMRKLVKAARGTTRFNSPQSFRGVLK